MSGVSGSSFAFLKQHWPDLAELGAKAELANERGEPDVVAFRLRNFGEELVNKLFRKLDLEVRKEDSQLDRLRELEKADLLDRRLMAKLHTIRKIGNRAAHNQEVHRSQAAALVEDAFSLASWFCRFMLPDLAWFTPWQPSNEAASIEGVIHDDRPARQSTATGVPSNVLRFPQGRVHRIRDEVARAMAQVDPRIRRLRTSMTLHEAFTDTLSGDQSRCLDALSDFLADPEQRIFLLKGEAGTGKTYLEKGITEYLSAQGRSFRLVAPTGRAAKIISEKTGRDARTIHSQIYDFGNMREYAPENGDLGTETFKFYASVASNQDQANTVYLVDEASLLSDAYSESEFFRSGTGYLLHDLINYVGFQHGENDKKIVFIGDTAQLLPIGMQTAPALDADYLCKHFGLKCSEYELKEVLRQKAESGVIRNVKPIRHSLSTGSFSSLGFMFDNDVQELSIESLLACYMAAVEKSGLPRSIMVCRSNKEAAALNRMVRERMFPGHDNVVAGDRLIVTANAIVHRAFIANGEFVDVIDVDNHVDCRNVTLRRKNEETGEVDITEVSLRFRNLRLSIPSTEGDSVFTCKVLDDYLHGDQAGIDPLHQRALYVDFLKRHPDLRRTNDKDLFAQVLRKDPYFNALCVRFGYAVTCHKAQGGEWEQVFVKCPKEKDPRTSDYFRWLYTAMTRSSEKLYLIDPPKIRLKVVGQPDPLDGSGETRPPSLSQFLAELHERVQGLVAGHDIEIEDVAHHQYQEAYYLRSGIDIVRVNIVYNGRLEVRTISVPHGGDFNVRLTELLQPLLGQGPGTRHTSTASTSPARPFLKAFHDRLVPILEAHGIAISGLDERQWTQRYTFARGDQSATVDIFYDGRDRLKRCMPAPGKRFNVGNGPFMSDIITILTSEVMP